MMSRDSSLMFLFVFTKMTNRFRVGMLYAEPRLHKITSNENNGEHREIGIKKSRKEKKVDSDSALLYQMKECWYFASVTATVNTELRTDCK